MFAATVSAYLIADGIPVFNGLISLVGSLLGAPIGLMIMGASSALRFRLCARTFPH